MQSSLRICAIADSAPLLPIPKSVVVFKAGRPAGRGEIPSKRADAIGSWLDETGARNISAWQRPHILFA